MRRLDLTDRHHRPTRLRTPQRPERGREGVHVGGGGAGARRPERLVLLHPPQIEMNTDCRLPSHL